MGNGAVIGYRLRQSVRAIPGVLEFQHAVNRGHEATIVDAGTVLCIEGFPRSANSFSVNMISMFLQLHRSRIANHTHSTANIRRAVRRDVPTIVLIRSPLASCRSLVKMRQNRLLLEDALGAYDDFYRRLTPLLHGVVLVPFDVTVKRPYALLETAAALTGMNIPEIHDPSFPKPPGLERDLLRQIIAAGGSPRPVEPLSPALADLVARCNARYASTLAAAPKVLSADGGSTGRDRIPDGRKRIA